IIDCEDTQGVSSQVLSTPVEGEVAPAAAERGPASIAIVKAFQPKHASLSRIEAGFVLGRQVPQGEDRPRRVVAVRYSARQRRPGPSTRRSPGVRVSLLVLLPKEPVA